MEMEEKKYADHPAYLEHLAEMIRIPTVSTAGYESQYHMEEFHTLLASLYPTLWKTAQIRKVGKALLFYIKGGGEKKPILFVAHMDVVAAEGEWKYPPFSGKIAEECIWGRGSLDMKGALCALLEALEECLLQGMHFDRDIYLNLSCDEEIGGPTTDKIARLLRKEQVSFEVVYDEGGTFVDHLLGKVKVRSAAVAIAEKGSAKVYLTARTHGGRAANPPKGTPIARLSDFVHYVEHHPFFKKRVPEEILLMYEKSAPYMKGIDRLIYGNRCILKHFGRFYLEPSMLGTTIAFTITEGGSAVNVIPEQAVITANVRVNSVESLSAALKKLRRIAKKMDIEVSCDGDGDAIKVTDIHCEGYRNLESCVREVFGEIPVIPTMLNGGTDSKHYKKMTENIVRFSPIYISPEQGNGVHGENERLYADQMEHAVAYYRCLLGKYRD